jgi:hypothetical protein
MNDNYKFLERFECHIPRPQRPPVLPWAAANYYNPFHGLNREDVLQGVVVRVEPTWGLVKTEAGTVWVRWGFDKKRRPQPRVLNELVAFKRADLERGEKGLRALVAYDGHWADGLPTAAERSAYNQAVKAYEDAAREHARICEELAEKRRKTLSEQHGADVVYRDGAFYVPDPEKMRAFEQEMRRLRDQRVLRQASERGLHLFVRWVRLFYNNARRWVEPDDVRGYRLSKQHIGALFANDYGVVFVTVNDDVLFVLWDDVETVEAYCAVAGYNPWGHEDRAGSMSRWVTLYQKNSNLTE